MNILFFHRWGINPTGGGVSQITHVLANEFSIHGYKVYYLGFQTGDGVEYADNQVFLPNKSELICEENIDYLNSFCTCVSTKSCGRLLSGLSRNSQKFITN